MEKKYQIVGMTCSACQAHVQKAVEKLAGITSCNVNLLSNSMQVSFDENILTDEKIKQAVKHAGYQALDFEEKSNKKPLDVEHKGRNLIISAIFGVILFYLAMGPMLHIPIPNIFINNPLILAITELLLTLPVIYLNRQYYINGYKRLCQLSPNMDSLIALGSSASLLYGIYVIYLMAYKLNLNQDISHLAHDLYLESASMILVLVSFGKFLESKSKTKTRDSIQKLLNLAPKTAFLKQGDGEKEIPVEQVKLGDVIIVKKGMQIPVDGKIIYGNGSINQSNITGESIPVFKDLADDVISSTILVNGYLEIEATKVGNDTTINTIIKLVEEAANSKAPISKLADRISFFFVPIVIMIALISFIIWSFLENPSFAFGIGISVLVIACPCALGLATPVAIMVSTGVAARNGLIIKNAEILEKTHSLKSIILDKTGTITQGKPKVIDIINYADTDILSIAYSLEVQSEHPLATAIIEAAKEKKMEPQKITDYQSHSGLGVEGIIAKQKYYIGNEKYLKGLEIDLSSYRSTIEKIADEGKTPLFIAQKTLLGIIAVKDPIKEDSKQAVTKLKKLGLNVIMLTGDNKRTAMAIASEVGITEVISDVLPDEKQKIVEQELNKGIQVAMVGDGVNDAPALMMASIGIAIGSGSDIAIDAADIVLVSDSLNDVYSAIKLSRRTINNIKGNLFWAFFYNTIGILLSTGIFYYAWNIKLNPMISALAMSFSSVFVVTNALRLNTFKIKEGGGKMSQVVINVEGMMCKHCQARVENALANVAGVSKVEVNLKKKTATVAYDGNNPDELVSAIVEQGYQAKLD